MKKFNTIVAVATPPGVGGIGVIRLSGPESKRVLRSVWTSEKMSVDNFASHRLYLGNIVDSLGTVIDRGLAVWMKAPHSYTGEDVVEIQGHGSPLLLEKILQACLAVGATLAGPGEFTKRAYLHGKIDLAQAEAVADVIASSSELGLAQAREHLNGTLSMKISEFQQELVRLRAYVEASIDFPEEDIELIQKEGILGRLFPIQVALSEFLATYNEGRLFREGVKTVLVGQPNVGKSSLLNGLVGMNRAIVHATPGTTRDVIEEGCQFYGISFRVFDTAGLRESPEEVEAIGVAKSEELLKEADLVLWVLDGSSGLGEQDIDFLSKLDLSRTIICINKTDLGLAWDPKAFVLDPKGDRLVLISALKGDGLKELQEKMADWVKSRSPRENSGIRITKLRHKESLEKALFELNQAEIALNDKNHVELVAINLKKAHESLGLITGADVSEDLLDSIFSEFCIGK
ncbi:MAG: tRNA uridine-5-carboxymethylaminomethyl(34) synthesis GTPase MnmE [Deltaproteobacteria bacterium]|nr:tRNA uridine-5-carboxymethylaminomethyl(34) synthesis GTPase MnmE [Deltaproteobacteria bacterium]